MTDTPPHATDSPRHIEPDCTCMGCRHFQEQAISNTIASARLSGIEATSEDRERMERLRTTIRERKELYEGLAAIPDADECPECPGTMTKHYPDCGEA
jgi:hypothetical protein